MRNSSLQDYYKSAKEWFLSSPYGYELVWQSNLNPNRISESNLLREHAWVVLNSGFKEAVVRKHFDFISLCFCDWESASEIVAHGNECIASAKTAFANSRKLDGILRMSQLLCDEGTENVIGRIHRYGISELRGFPFIGKITCFHLAKNLGFDVSKPDRHLERLAKFYDFKDTTEMCEQISITSGDDRATIDLILWRHLEQKPFKQIQNSSRPVAPS